MKRGIIFFLFVLLSFSFIFAEETSLAPSEQTDVVVTVDGTPPDIVINKPKPINYNTAIPIRVNYTVFDLSPDSEWYSLDYGENLTIPNPFFLVLNEGNYNLRIYANDSFGRVNYTDVEFSVNDSSASCGDDYCDASESCLVCEEDCGVCPIVPPIPSNTGGSSGGRSVRTEVPKKVNITIDKEEVSVSLRGQETKTVYITIENHEPTSVNMEVTPTSSLVDYLRVRESSFVLGPGEKKILAVDFISYESLPPELYAGGLIFSVKGFDKEVFVALEIESETPLFDVIVSIPEKFLVVRSGEEFVAEVQITEVGKVGKVDVRLEKIIKDSKGNVIFEKEDTLAVDGSLSFIETITIPQGVKSGKYVFYITAYYDGQSAIGSHVFEIVQMSSTTNFILLIMVLIFLSLIYLVFRKHK